MTPAALLEGIYSQGRYFFSSRS